MACLAALCLLLLAFPLSSSQSTVQQSEQQINGHQAPAAAPPPPTHIQDFLRKEDTNHAKRAYGRVDNDNAKVGLFIAAALGTFTLMAAVYCIYNKFYTKQQYLHTQLDDDTDLTSDPMDSPSVFFQTSVNSSAIDVRKAGYGSLSDTPSIICVPPSLSPPPSAMPFPPRFLSSQSLRTISAQDLEKSCT
ncbi:sodium-dependent neutral amino acid transporter B(0)AT2 [Solea senegalensis]|nr:sodium-dependent neutral amino acid transporter B(0)AT2 [Solea senegalensis]